MWIRKHHRVSTDVDKCTEEHESLPAFSYAAMLLLLPVVASRVWSWVSRAGSSTVWDYGPAQFAFTIHRFAEGSPLYRDFHDPPYVPVPYGPVVPYAVALLSHSFGSGPMAALEAGRALTIAATLAVCILIYLMGRRSAASRGAALIAALAFALSPMLEPWGFEFRVDMPGLAFELAGLYLFSLGRGYWAIASFVVGFFTKPYHFAGIGAVALSCWFAGEWRKGLGLLATWAGIVVLGTLVLQAVFPYYLLNTFEELSPLYNSLRIALVFPTWMLVGNFSIFILAAAAVVESSRARRLSVLFLVVAAFQDLIACMRWGSNVYYLLPTLAALTIISANGIDVLIRLVARSTRLRQAWIGAALAVSVLAQLYVVSIAYSGYKSISVAELARAGLRCCYISDAPLLDPAALRLLGQIDGPILTDMPELLLADERKSIWFMELFVLPGMRERGLFDDGPLLAMIRERRIAAIALGRESLERQWAGIACFWPELKAAIVDNYYTVSSVGPPYIALPRSRVGGEERRGEHAEALRAKRQPESSWAQQRCGSGGGLAFAGLSTANGSMSSLIRLSGRAGGSLCDEATSHGRLLRGNIGD